MAETLLCYSNRLLTSHLFFIFTSDAVKKESSSCSGPQDGSLGKTVCRLLLCCQFVLHKLSSIRVVTVFIYINLTAGEDDLVEITDQLMDLDQSDIYNLGLVLGLAHRRLVDLIENSRSNLAFLDAVVLHWLQRDDRVKEVSWAALVKALLHQRLGHTGIATSIAKKYGTQLCPFNCMTASIQSQRRVGIVLRFRLAAERFVQAILTIHNFLILVSGFVFSSLEGLL